MAKLKVIALLRVSGAGQAGPEREGLPVQREDCLALAHSHGLDIVEWVTLEGVSGAAVLQNPHFTGLLDRLQAPDIHGLVVGAFDRLFRRGRFSDYAILDAFVDAGAMLYTPQGVYDMAKDSDALLGFINTEISSSERRNIARRTRAGRERRRREKGWLAEGNGTTVGVPRGVQFDHETKTWSYVFPEADRVREVYRLFLGGEHNFAAISRATGIGQSDNSSGSASWAIRTVLTHPLYMGIYRVDRRWLPGGRWVPRDPEDCYEHTALDPPLIDPRDWHRVQERLAELGDRRPRLPAVGDRPLDYLGHLYCAGCGGQLGSRRENRGRKHMWHYQCARAEKKAVRIRQGKEPCSAFRGMIGAKVDPHVSAILEEVLGDPDTLAQLIEETLRSEAETVASQPHEAERRITALENRRRRVIDGYEAGVIQLDELRKRVTSIDAEIRALRALQSRQSAFEIDSDAVAAVAEVFASWRDLGRVERLKLMSAFGVCVGIAKRGTGKRATPHVEWVRLGTLGDLRAVLSAYKKLKRLGIE